MVKLLRFKLMLLMAMVLMGAGNVWGETTYEQLTSIADIDESAEYVLGIDGTGFHYDGTTSWGKTALPANKTPIYYKLTKASDGNSFTAQAKISGTTYYLQIPTSNTFSMSTSTGTNTDIIIGTTQVTGTNSAVANKSTTNRHLRINGTSGLRSYAGTTGTMAFFYKVINTVSYTITAESNNTELGTVDLSGSIITATPKSGCRINSTTPYTVTSGNATVVQNGNEFAVTPTSNCTVQINFEAIPTHTATFSVNGTTTTQDFAEGAKITFPANPAAIDDKIFTGWYGSTYSHATEAPTFIDTDNTTMGTEDKTFYAVFAEVTPGTSTTKTDNLTTSTFGSPSSYSNWSGKSATGGSNAVYAGNSTTYDNKAIQIRSTNPSGIVTTTSGGKAKKVTITWNSNTTTDRTLDIYGKNTAYSEPSNLYSSKASEQGKKLGSIVYGTSTELTITCDSTYIGLRSYSGAMYIDKIEIEWETGTPDTYFNYCTTVVPAAVVKPEITLGANPFLFSTTATITCDTEGAAIKYSYDNSTWSDYSSTLTITETKTIYAKAIKGEEESSVAQVTATKNLAEPTVTVNGDLTLDLDGETNVSAGTLTAAVKYSDAAIDGATVTWSGNNDAVATIDASTGAVTIITTGEVTFTATYAANSDYAKATGTKTVTVINSMAPGSLKNPYTVAQARAAIDAGIGVTGVYAEGIVSGIATEYSSTYHNISYNISVDGETTSDQLQAYRGKSFNGTNFTSEDNIKVGDKVVIYGDLKKYKSTYEFDEANQLYSLEKKVSVTSAGYATYCTTFALNFATVTGLKAYVAEDKGTTVEFSVVTEIPENEGMLLKGAEGDYYVPAITSAADVENEFIGVLANTKIDAEGAFVLMNGAKGVGFYKNSNDFTVGANTAYLPASVAAEGRKFIGLFNDEEEVTGINEVKTLKNYDAIYDLRGMRVTTPKKGLYIKGGKKIVFKYSK
jgi:hypothetical protein